MAGQRCQDQRCGTFPFVVPHVETMLQTNHVDACARSELLLDCLQVDSLALWGWLNGFWKIEVLKLHWLIAHWEVWGRIFATNSCILHIHIKLIGNVRNYQGVLHVPPISHIFLRVAELCSLNFFLSHGEPQGHKASNHSLQMTSFYGVFSYHHISWLGIYLLTSEASYPRIESNDIMTSIHTVLVSIQNYT